MLLEALDRASVHSMGASLRKSDQVLLEALDIPGHTIAGGTAEASSVVAPNHWEAALAELEFGWTVHKYARPERGDAAHISAGQLGCLQLYHPEVRRAEKERARVTIAWELV